MSCSRATDGRRPQQNAGEIYMTNGFDAIVVGTGPAGATFAKELSQRGASFRGQLSVCE